MANDPRGVGNHPRLRFWVEVNSIDHSWWVYMVFLGNYEHKLWFGVLGDLRVVWLGFVGGFWCCLSVYMSGFANWFGYLEIGQVLGWENPFFAVCDWRSRHEVWSSRDLILSEILGFGHRSWPVIGHVATCTLRCASGFVWPRFEVVRPRGARGSSEGPFLGYCGVYLRCLSW